MLGESSVKLGARMGLFSSSNGAGYKMLVSLSTLKGTNLKIQHLKQLFPACFCSVLPAFQASCHFLPIFSAEELLVQGLDAQLAQFAKDQETPTVWGFFFAKRGWSLEDPNEWLVYHLISCNPILSNT